MVNCGPPDGPATHFPQWNHRTASRGRAKIISRGHKGYSPMTFSLARIALVLAFLAPPLLPATRPAGPPPAASLHYQSPVAGALYVMPATALAWRLDDALDPNSLTPA